MSAHPMIQPVDWSQSPKSLKGAVSAERLAIYETIWNSAIATTLRAPHLVYTRTLAWADGVPVSVLAVTAQGQYGYWSFRQDFPSIPCPYCDVPPGGRGWRITAAQCVRVKPVTLGRLVRAMESGDIGTPSSTAEHLRGAMEGAKALLTVKKGPSLSHPQGVWVVGVTLHGKQALAAWRDTSLLPNAPRVRADLKAVAAGEKTPDQVLAVHFPDTQQEKLDRLVASIAEKCEKWRGLSHADGLNALARGGVKPPRLTGLPPWLDPEKQLPQAHPLRALRIRMEQELAEADPNWLAQEQSERSRRRRHWLETRRVECPEMPELEGEGARFNALVHWLLGAPAVAA